MPYLNTFCPVEFCGAKINGNSNTSHTTACDLPVPSPGRSNPSARLWKRRVCFVLPESAEKWVNYLSFCVGNFSTSNRKTMATPKASHTAACDLPAPSPGQPNPSSCLSQRWVRFVLPQSAGKLVKYPTFWATRALTVA